MKCQFCNVYGVCIKYSSLEGNVYCVAAGCTDFTPEEEEDEDYEET